MDEQRELIELPVGFETFDRRPFLNYQFNRAYGLGWADAGELRKAARRVESWTSCVQVFETLAAEAEASGRLRHAVGYSRIAEFFTAPRGPEKVERYRRYRDLFDAAVPDSGFTRHAVGYAGTQLPVYRLPAVSSQTHGAVLLHGGFDSLIEEFYPIWQRLSAAGFDVFAFDGPGQGGARRLSNLTFDHDWEKPVGAILDHFALPSAGLVGISMGGYWALRAAGREPRIDRVVAWPPVYDWLQRVPAALRGLTRVMLRRRAFMRWSIRVRTRLSPTLRQVVDQVLYVTDRDDPVAVVDWFLGMNSAHLASDRVRQPVLLMCAEADAFQPPILTRAQAAALTNARSVTVRMFTKAEHADRHCQIGNVDLACRELTTWLRTVDR